ncbi:hypothetical protein [Baekduia sp. Peel2402]|uniref:hypothetical protein n=1 Tax=Baekduia sp. Peel2402 TaxID=3458296 RepID=UPI00403EBFD9
MDQAAMRALLMGMPQAEEYEHGGLPAFRIRGKPRFATMLDDEGVNLFPGEEGILAFTQSHPQWCTERWWGKQLAAVRLHYADAPRELVEDLVLESWSARAPKRLLSTFEGF